MVKLDLNFGFLGISCLKNKFHDRSLSCQGTHLKMPPKPHCNSPFWTLLGLVHGWGKIRPWDWQIFWSGGCCAVVRREKSGYLCLDCAHDLWAFILQMMMYCWKTEGGELLTFQCDSTATQLFSTRSNKKCPNFISYLSKITTTVFRFFSTLSEISFFFNYWTWAATWTAPHSWVSFVSSFDQNFPQTLMVLNSAEISSSVLPLVSGKMKKA